MPFERKGNFVRQRIKDPADFDSRSLRTIVREDEEGDTHKIVVGCPKGKYDAKSGRCEVGTQAQAILHPIGEKKSDTKEVMRLLRKK